MNYKQKLLDGVTRHMERRFPVGDGTCRYLSVTGEPYIVLAIGGIKPEGEGPKSEGQVTHASACDAFKAEFDRFSARMEGVLYWRRKPEYSDDAGRFQVTARFLISSKPRLSDAELRDRNILDYIEKA